MPDVSHPYPPNTTFHDLIAQNRRNTVLLVIAMGLLIVALAAGIAAAVMQYGAGVIRPEGVAIAIGVAVVVVLLSTTFSYFGGAATILRISGAREIDKSHDPQLFNVVEELSIAAGLPMPRVYFIESPALNAFATGRDPNHAAVAITRGLRERLTRDELTAVMAHEMAHVRHYDIRLTMMIATMVGLIVLTCDVFLRSAFYSGGRRRGNNSGGGAGAIVMIVIALLLAIVAPILARVIQFAVSRQREFLADAGAVELTRNPQGLIDALRKLSADHTPLETANRATAHLYIDNPFLQARGAEEWNSVFSTHPPMSQRVARLEALLR